jgi:CTP:molybdopterin cytidylyltransferase MocA
VTTGIILAAGESRRMGFPKALLRYRDETFLDTLIGLFAARCEQVIVVLGAEAERIRAGSHRPADFVLNLEYRTGMTGSLQCGLRARSSVSEGVLFTLVDHPAVLPATLDALLAPPRPLLRVPRYRGKRGHPVWCRRELSDEFLALGPAGAARDVVHAHAAQTDFLDLDDAGITADIDDTAAYHRLMGVAP